MNRSSIVVAIACCFLSGCAHTTLSFEGIDYARVARASTVHIEVVVEDWSNEVVVRTTTYRLAMAALVP